MMSSSRPVTDPKRAVFEELIARPLSAYAILGLYRIARLKEASLVLRRFKDLRSATGRAVVLYLSPRAGTPLEAHSIFRDVKTRHPRLPSVLVAAALAGCFTYFVTSPP